MIRNIVFDMGNVLVYYRPMVPCLRHAQTQEDADAILQALFLSPEWEQKIDSCLISEEEMLSIAQSRLQTAHLRELCAQVLADYHTDAMTPIPGMEQLVYSLKERGFGVYLLSNVGERFAAFRHILPGIDLFDGLVLSGQEKITKPDPAIYQRLFDRFQLKPEECLFVDDRALNIEAGKALGMDGYVFSDADVPALQKFLDGLADPA